MTLGWKDQLGYNFEFENKTELKKHGLHLKKSKEVKTPRIKEAKAILECRVTRFLAYDGDHIILVGEVVHAEAEKGGLDEINPLLHDSGEKFRNQLNHFK